MGRGKRARATQRTHAGLALSDGDGRSRLQPAISLDAPEPAAAESAAEPAESASRRQSSSSPAANARVRKHEKPELYCPDRNCLWMTGEGPCPKHGGVWSKEREQLARRRSRGEATAAELERLAELGALRA